MYRFSSALAFVLLLTACGGGVTIEDGKQYVDAEKGISFSEPDIKDQFCGVHINFQFCKCAFHNQYCGNIGMDKSGANSHVYAQYNAWVQGLKNDFSEACTSNGGFMDGKDCYGCPEGSELEGQRCRVSSEEDSEEEMENEEENEEVVDCEEIEENWEKYSDIDFRIPEGERSYEAGQYAKAQTDLVNTYAEQAELVYETDLLRDQLEGVRGYKAALVDNLRDNLVKATLRLSYVTYSQVQGAKGAGDSFSKMLTSAEGIEALGAGMKAVQSVIPGDSKLAINTKNVDGKVKSIGWNATLEAIESMGDPSAIAQQVMKDSRGAVMPSADISPEEIEILRAQNLENNLLDDVIAEIEAEIADNERWLSVADARIKQLETDAVKWKDEEKARVLRVTEEECE